MNRRSFLKVMGATAVGGTIASIVGLETSGTSQAATAPKDAPKAVAQERTLDAFKYKGREIQLMELGDEQMLHINGQAMPDMAFSKIDTGYASHMLPFETFKSPRDLAKKLVDGDGKLFVLSGSHSM